MILAIEVQSYSIPHVFFGGAEGYPIPQNAGGHYSGMAQLSNRLLSAILLVGGAALGVLLEPYEYTLPKFHLWRHSKNVSENTLCWKADQKNMFAPKNEQQFALEKWW